MFTTTVGAPELAAEAVAPSPSSTCTVGYFFVMSSHVNLLCTIANILGVISSLGSRICIVESRSRSVTDPSANVWKSTVTANGTPSSSEREYRRPNVADDLSTRVGRSLSIKSAAISSTWATTKKENVRMISKRKVQQS